MINPFIDNLTKLENVQVIFQHKEIIFCLEKNFQDMISFIAIKHIFSKN